MTTPHQLAGYRLLRQIGRSAMSTIYLARGDRQGSAALVAIKVLDKKLVRQGDEMVRRFEVEAHITASIDHHNVVKVIEHGVDQDRPYMVMEYLEGASFATLMDASTSSDPMPMAFWAHLCARASEGLHAIHELRVRSHQQELVHADVSPKNLFVTLEGTLKVLDLGLVRPAGPPPTMERDGKLAGTYPYLAPERVERGSADRRADLFSLGTILYEATTLTRLFKGKTERETLENVRGRPIRPPHLIDASYPRRLESIIMGVLRRDPSGRRATAAELANELDLFVTDDEGGAWSTEQIVPLISERIMALIGRSVESTPGP